MHLTINRATLARELALLASVAERKTTVPILTSVRLEARGESLQLTATDLECGLVSTIPAQVAQEGALCIPAKRLSDFVRTLAGDSVDIAVSPNNYATVKCGKARARIPGNGVESFPELPQAPEPIVTMDARALARQFARVAFAVPVNEVQNTVRGLLVIFAPGTVECVAMDGHRLSRTLAESPATKDARVIVPVGALAYFAKTADSSEGGEVVALAQDDNYIFFTVGQRSIVARKTVGSFIDHNRLLPKNYEALVVAASAELKAALDSVRQFGEHQAKGGISRSVTLKFSPSEIGVSASSADAGECESAVACEYAGAEITACFDPAYLADFIAAAGERVEMCVRDARTATEMRPAGDANYRYIVMPKRLN
jgi:DNA polymerase-3 subunit beta